MARCWLVMIMLLGACGSARRSDPPPSVGAQPTAPGAATAEATAIPAALPDGWTSVTWQGLVIPVPPGARWHESETPAPREQQTVLAEGSVLIPTPSGVVVEAPTGPVFQIVAFDGSLEDWIAAEQGGPTSQAGNTVEPHTVQPTAIGGLPAVIYQRTVTGTGLLEYYAVKLSGDQLLAITSDNAYPLNPQIIELLQLVDRQASQPAALFLLR